MGCFSFLFGAVLGAGVGSYKSDQLKDCMDDTFHLGKQTAKPIANHIATKGPDYVRQGSDMLRKAAAGAMNNEKKD
eukprot:CAMPEP_0169115522 /NCGR_PEP_ID=MMETSP1015-20121227/29381_1 /TAXON_ID=342587 /ORGANISM="Karlodinium micrum, Strain CCMP2283" /LENGTH=75 /DNA_ID=CAMNT_0009177967 /DNA_START=101 /DNA_END=328 /DNA_ORIENTATION=-